MSSRKAARRSVRRQERNVALRSRAKTLVRKVRRSSDQGEMETAESELHAAIVALDKAAQKGALHSNNTARRKSRLIRHVNAAKDAA